MMRRRVSSLTDNVGSPLSSRDTVACEKPDFCAISFIVTIVEPSTPQYVTIRSISVNNFTT